MIDCEKEVWAQDIEGKKVVLVTDGTRENTLLMLDGSGEEIPNVLGVHLHADLANDDGSKIIGMLYINIELYHLYPDGVLFYTETARCHLLSGKSCHA